MGSTLPVFYLQNGNKLYVVSSVWIIYVPKLICLSFRSNFSYQIQMQIFEEKYFRSSEKCREMFSEWFPTSLLGSSKCEYRTDFFIWDWMRGNPI